MCIYAHTIFLVVLLIFMHTLRHYIIIKLNFSKELTSFTLNLEPRELEWREYIYYYSIDNIVPPVLLLSMIIVAIYYYYYIILLAIIVFINDIFLQSILLKI